MIQDYGFRLYNPAIAKFLSFDPLAPEYPMLTPYQFASNTPIRAIDRDGLEGDCKFMWVEANRVAPRLGITSEEYLGIERGNTGYNIYLGVKYSVQGGGTFVSMAASVVGSMPLYLSGGTPFQYYNFWGGSWIRQGSYQSGQTQNAVGDWAVSEGTGIVVGKGLYGLGKGAKSLFGTPPPSSVLSKQSTAVSLIKPSSQVPTIGSKPIKNITWVSSAKYPNLYRGDTRLPATIFKEGFKPKGGTTDLYDYVANWKSSEFVSTSINPKVGIEFAEMNGGGYLYILDNLGDGIDVNKTFSDANVRVPFPHEQEASIMRHIPTSQIQGAYQLNKAGEKIKYIANPNYKSQ